MYIYRDTQILEEEIDKRTDDLDEEDREQARREWHDQADQHHKTWLNSLSTVERKIHEKLEEYRKYKAWETGHPSKNSAVAYAQKAPFLYGEEDKKSVKDYLAATIGTEAVTAGQSNYNAIDSSANNHQLVLAVASEPTTAQKYKTPPVGFLSPIYPPNFIKDRSLLWFQSNQGVWRSDATATLELADGSGSSGAMISTQPSNWSEIPGVRIPRAKAAPRSILRDLQGNRMVRIDEIWL